MTKGALHYCAFVHMYCSCVCLSLKLFTFKVFPMLQLQRNISSCMLISAQRYPCGTEHFLGSHDSCGICIFVTVIYNFANARLNDGLCTFVTWEKRHINASSLKAATAIIQYRIQFTVRCIKIFVVISALLLITTRLCFALILVWGRRCVSLLPNNYIFLKI